MSEHTAKLATREELLTPRPRRYKVLDPLPISGLVLRVQSLSEREGSAYEDAAWRTAKNGQREIIPEKLRNAGPRLIVLCAVDADGKRLFTDADAQLLADNLDKADAESAYDQCAAHIGLRKQDIEALAKNSETALAAS